MGKITIKGIGDWVDLNESLMSMFQIFEPPARIDDKNAVFLPLSRDESHIQVNYGISQLLAIF